ncbi:hypothetical protein [Streptomyces minutiscleroticus]|uniref:Uncharacterized protein n=1 Tax=Streptomyces minutiscleroticus TaxID=68238 RepID=A0A918KPU7_9ACTN|nr:hypothetical protein [Streptomyces minutiscleroticus]GGX72036.1 hypothetical protein GCM10010358_27980 [Streptomyces minutiscleroticus]
MIQCPNASCRSTNIEFLPHYWQSLPDESPLKDEYKPPAVAPSQFWWVLAIIALGVVVAVLGAVLLGLLVVLGGLVWGALVHTGISATRTKLASWDTSHICLACTRRF